MIWFKTKRQKKNEAFLQEFDLDEELAALSDRIGLLEMKKRPAAKAKKATPQTSIRELLGQDSVPKLTVKAIRILTEKNIYTVGQLTEKTENELLAFKELGVDTLGYIQDMLGRNGFSLSPPRRVASKPSLAVALS